MESSMMMRMTLHVRRTEVVVLGIVKLREWQTWTRAAWVRPALFDDFQPDPNPGKQYERNANAQTNAESDFQGCFA
jgi:hypothetical protein